MSHSSGVSEPSCQAPKKKRWLKLPRNSPRFCQSANLSTKVQLDTCHLSYYYNLFSLLHPHQLSVSCNYSRTTLRIQSHKPQPDHTQHFATAPRETNIYSSGCLLVLLRQHTIVWYSLQEVTGELQQHVSDKKGNLKGTAQPKGISMNT